MTNCLYALQEMMSDEGGMAVNQSMILGLLSCVEIFSEWGLCQVGLIRRPLLLMKLNPALRFLTPRVV